MAGFGETLQQARAVKNVTLKEVEKATRITRQQLHALEQEAFDSLPPMIYQRGIVRKYAVYLDLDPAKMLALFEEAHGTIGTKPETRGPQAVPPIDMPSHWAPNFAIIAFAVVLAAIVFAWVYSAYVAPSDANPTATAVVPTLTPYAADIALPTEVPVTPTKVPPTVTPTSPPQPTATATATVAPTQPSANGDNQAGGSVQAPTSESADAGNGDNQRGATQPQDQNTQQTAAEQPTPASPDTSADTTSQATTSGSGDTSGNSQRIANADASNNYVAGIVITAGSADIDLTVVADGETVFSGTLAAGQSTAQFDGTSFDVTTSSGTNTIFTNSCGTTFNMGYEAGSASYTLNADSGSCHP